MIVANATEWEQILQLQIGLEILIFLNTDFLEFGDLVSILRLSPAMRELRLERCFHVSNILLQSLADYTPFLENLYLSGCLLTDANLKLLANRCKNLKKVDFSCSNMTMNALLILMESSPWLEEMDLSEINTLGDIPKEIPSLVFPSILKSINLRNTVINDVILKHIASNSPRLQTLILEDCSSITDSGVLKVSNCCLELETLDLSFCFKITDLSIQAFAAQANSNTTKLKEVHLAACELITPATIHHFVKKCRKLELLILDGCDKMVDTLIHECATIKDEVSCTLERKELIFLAQLPIQQASFQKSEPVGFKAPTATPNQSVLAATPRNKSRSIMASASSDTQSIEMAFVERTDRIKQNRLSRGSFISTQNNEPPGYAEIHPITDKGKKLAMRRSTSTSSSDRVNRSEQIDMANRIFGNLRTRSNTVAEKSLFDDISTEKKPIRPRPATIMAGVINAQARPRKFSSSSNESVGSNHFVAEPEAMEPVINETPFKYSQDNRGRHLTTLKVEIVKGLLKELSLHEFDNPSALAVEFCSHHDSSHLAGSLTRMLTIRKHNALRKLK